jgi:hypothetical protein
MRSRCIGAFVLGVSTFASGLLSSAQGSSAPGDDDASGARGRGELATVVQRAFKELKPLQSGKLETREQIYGLPFRIVEGNGVRVLSAGGEDEEARRVASAMGAARMTFVELTGIAATYPSGVSAYLLGSPAAKEAFLGRHPRLPPEASARLAKLEGAGVPNTADWAWWEGDAEKRLDGMVRFGFDWLFRTQQVTTEKNAWLHEGLGLYLTHAMVGTYLTFFVQPVAGEAKRRGLNLELRAQMSEPGADWMRLARGLFAEKQVFDLEELLHLEPAEMEPVDYVRAHALAGYLVEVHREGLGNLVKHIGAGDDPRASVEEALGFPFGELRTRLDAWLAHRDALVAKADGRLSEAELRALWGELDAGQRGAAVAALRRLSAALDTQQMRWLKAINGATTGSPPAAEDPPIYDPKVHAPKQVIPRTRLASTDARVKSLRATLRPPSELPAPSLAYDYDWARATVVRVGDPDEPEAVFENALLGVPPEADLARARVLARLDRAEERKLQAAFAHAYTDRDGNAYPLTLFDLWASGQTIEMPDVDALGIVHEVLDDWKHWTAPIPPAQHEPLYKRLGELFKTCKRSRELRLSLADLFLAPGAAPRPGYETLTLNFQALWAGFDSDPVKLAKDLPSGENWEAYLTSLTDHCLQDYKYYSFGRRRAAQLRRDGEQLGKALSAALAEGKAYVAPPPVETPPARR